MNTINIIIGTGMVTGAIFMFFKLLVGGWAKAIKAFLVFCILLFGVTGGIVFVMKGIGII